MYRLDWNKKHTKIKIYSTISEGYVTNFETLEYLENHPKYRDLILKRIYKICPCCMQKLPDEA